MITELPYEVLVNTFSLLPNPPTMYEALVCKVFHGISQDRALWKEWALRIETITEIPLEHSDETTWKMYQKYVAEVSLYLRYTCTVGCHPIQDKYRVDGLWLEKANVERYRYFLRKSDYPRGGFSTVRPKIPPETRGFRYIMQGRDSSSDHRDNIPYNHVKIDDKNRILSVKETAELFGQWLINNHVRISYEALAPLESVKLGITKKISASYQKVPGRIPFFSLYPRKNIEHLCLNDYLLEEIPLLIRSCFQLKSLNLRGNHISCLPDWLTELKNLKKIDLSLNRLHRVPRIIRKLETLKKLSLGDNLISTLPTWTTELDSLQELNLENNQFKVYPRSLTNMSQIQVRFSGNPCYYDFEPNRLDRIIAQTGSDPHSFISHITHSSLTSLFLAFIARDHIPTKLSFLACSAVDGGSLFFGLVFPQIGRQSHISWKKGYIASLIWHTGYFTLAALFLADISKSKTKLLTDVLFLMASKFTIDTAISYFEAGNMIAYETRQQLLEGCEGVIFPIEKMRAADPSRFPPMEEIPITHLI